MEFTLLYAALLATGAVYLTLRWLGRRRPELCVRDVWDLALAGGLTGLAAGRVAAMLSAGTNPLRHPGDFVIVRSGVDPAAATIAAIATAAFLGRKALWRNLDALAPAALAGLAGWHLGCLVRGACLGTPSSLPWAVAQQGSDITRHPVEIYAAAAFALAAYAAGRLLLRFPPAGAVAGLGLAAAGGVRLLTEPFRPGLGGGPLWWYGAALGLGLALAAGVSVRARLKAG